MEWLSNRRLLLVIAMLIALGLGVWMFAFETLPGGWTHRNRITGAVCSIYINAGFALTQNVIEATRRDLIQDRARDLVRDRRC
jgi:hypothetical protein